MLLNLTYTFPPLFALGFDMQKHAIRKELNEGFDPTTGYVTRQSSRIGRLMRGYFSGGMFQVATNIWHTIYFFASLATCGLGMYAACKGKSFIPHHVSLLSF
jgi:hypothetical protein